MRDSEPDPSQDPDVTHLRNLLTLLRPLDDREFWDFFNHRHSNHEGKIGFHLRAFEESGDPASLALLCRGLLLYFSNSDHAMWLHLGNAHFDLDPNDYSEPGRYLAEDICSTAWKVYVRYHPRYGPGLVP
jgi:hypothetical protein